MFDRILGRELRAAAAEMPVVTLVGPRQSGKTTLARHVFPQLGYASLERPDVRGRALADPVGFLANYPQGVILDEVQRAPELISYVQVAADEDPRPGRFVLTGSQNLLLMEQISQTLAGRTAVLTLLPLAITELLGRPPLDPSALDTPHDTPPVERSLWQTVWSGLYPRIHDRGLRPDRWLSGYERTYVERDLRAVLRVMDLDAFQRFLRLAAARTGRLLNLSELAADAGIAQPTAKQWLTALRVGFLVTLLPPHHANFRKRIRRRPKLHFLDTGLACHLLGIRDAATLELHPLRGPLFESFVVSELTKAFWNTGRPAPLYHWRDATGHEVDVVVDLGDRLLPVEVKSAQTLHSSAADSLCWWTALPENPNEGGLLVHGGAARPATLRGVTVLPWHLR